MYDESLASAIGRRGRRVEDQRGGEWCCMRTTLACGSKAATRKIDTWSPAPRLLSSRFATKTRAPLLTLWRTPQEVDAVARPRPFARGMLQCNHGEFLPSLRRRTESGLGCKDPSALSHLHTCDDRSRTVEDAISPSTTPPRPSTYHNLPLL